MDTQEQILFQLTRDLLSAAGEMELARAVDSAAKSLGLPVAMTFMTNESGTAIRPLPEYMGELAELKEVLAEWTSLSPDISRIEVRLGPESPFHPLTQGRRICTPGYYHQPDQVEVPLATFFAEFTAAGLGLAEAQIREISNFLEHTINYSEFCLIPLGEGPPVGALLLTVPPDTSQMSPRQLRILTELGTILEPALARFRGHEYLERMAAETVASVQIATILARPRLSLDRKLGLALEVILQELKAETGSIMLKKGQKLIVRAATTKSIRGLSQSIREDSIAAHVARTGEPLNLGQVSVSDLFAPRSNELSTYRSEQVLAVPIKAGSKVVGVLNITNRLEDKNFVRLEESQVARFVDRIALLIERASLMESLTKERTRLRKANKELKKLEQVKQDLTRMVIHDLKGPLSEVVANLHLIKDEELSELGIDALDSAFIGTDDLSRLIANLLDIARLDEGKLKINPQPFGIDQLLVETAERFKSLLALEDLTVDFELMPDPPPIMADRNLVGRILQNLMTNAIQHTRAETTITFRTRVENRRLIIGLADQGPGVDPRHRETIFERFTGHPDRDRPKTSTGLGLTFCRMAVEAHKGRIWVDGAEGGGAEFKFTLPLAEEQ